MNITGKTQIVGLIGWPVSHSISPHMHNAAFSRLGLDWCYMPLPVPTEPTARVGEAIQGLRALGLRGCNVTVPHKQAVMPHLDSLTSAAQAIGAVNTIRVEPDGTFLGDNTDARGLVADLRDHGVDPAGQHILIIGAGGSGRAALYGLAEAGAESITVLNRTHSKAASLVNDIQPYFSDCPFVAGAFPEQLVAAASAATLVVNCTSLGMTPNVEGLPWNDQISFRADQTVYDLIYNPAQTRLLAKAEADGARVINGLGMLIWQGAIAFEVWTGQAPPVDVMAKAVQGIL